MPTFQGLASEIKAGRIKTLRDLINKGVKPELARSTSGVTLLAVAVKCENIEACKLLLEAGANPNAASDKGVTPPHNAAKNRNLAICQILIDAGGNTKSPFNSWAVL